MTKAVGTRIAATVLLGLVLLLAPAALAWKGGKGAGRPNGWIQHRIVGRLPDSGPGIQRVQRLWLRL